MAYDEVNLPPRGDGKSKPVTGSEEARSYNAFHEAVGAAFDVMMRSGAQNSRAIFGFCDALFPHNDYWCWFKGSLLRTVRLGKLKHVRLQMSNFGAMLLGEVNSFEDLGNFLGGVATLPQETEPGGSTELTWLLEASILVLLSSATQECGESPEQQSTRDLANLGGSVEFLLAEAVREGPIHPDELRRKIKEIVQAHGSDWPFTRSNPFEEAAPIFIGKVLELPPPLAARS